MMAYLACLWLHDHPDDPILIVSELDFGGYEVRKVEVFRNGMVAWADDTTEYNGAVLGEVPVPALAAINADPQFRAWEIDEAAFERYWSLRQA